MIKRIDKRIKPLFRGNKRIARAYNNDKIVYGAEEKWEGLTIEVISTYQDANKNIFSITNNGANASTKKPNIEYSINGGRWKQYTTTVQAKTGDIIRLRGDNASISSSASDYSVFNLGAASSDSSIKIYGNIMSLLSRYNYKTLTSVPNYCFFRLFKNSNAQGLRDASGIILPASKVGQYAYRYMFADCLKLATGPKKLPATTLGSYCYADMFSSCGDLNIAPELPAMTMADHCYYNMFFGCHIASAPELPATTLARYCYAEMFARCGSLKSAPKILPATTLANNCYDYMFGRCTSLTTTPELPATTLVTSCYYQMFKMCSSLKTITIRTTNWTSSNATEWVASVSSTGTFYNLGNATIETGVNGIPTGWTVLTSK